ncbi:MULTISPECIES: response regulator [unclassified Thalassotalea]|uniref:response regulator n=1 Tax=unclassified Thalassotalea TaxID=2614972 RepID=UPI001081EB44|nr:MULTISPECIES: response regulator [unclassified Thalassotalea]NMP16640.1 response regulator [Thalassotalea sp. Y01]QBY03017.1 response regulator [Thalassotalea sp. HSM 43]
MAENKPSLKKILLVEDDRQLSDLIKDFLVSEGFHVKQEFRGDTVAKTVENFSPDLIVLDVMLPGKDGFTVCRDLRPSYSNPILMLTAKSTDFDQVLGLEIGADDYVAKPVEPRVLLARVNALLRRGQLPKGGSEKAEISCGKLHVNRNSRQVTLDTENIELTSQEFDLLWLLATRAGEVQNRDYIYKAVVGREYDGMDRSVDVRISRLRKKLHDSNETPFRIKTIWGQGYLFVPDAWE